MADEEQASSQTDAEKVFLQPRKIYIKDVSFESPNAPAIFTEDWDPALAVDIEHEIKMLPDDSYEVVLTISARATVEDTTAFHVEVQQGGIFFIKGFNEKALQRRLNVYCLTVLYPYACATVDSLLVKGGFPPIHLSPVSFRARYQQTLKEAENNDEDPE